MIFSQYAIKSQLNHARYHREAYGDNVTIVLQNREDLVTWRTGCAFGPFAEGSTLAALRFAVKILQHERSFLDAPSHAASSATARRRKCTRPGLIHCELRERIASSRCHFVKFIFLTRVYTLSFLADTDIEEKDTGYRRFVCILLNHPAELGDHLTWHRALAPSGGFASQQPQELN